MGYHVLLCYTLSTHLYCFYHFCWMLIQMVWICEGKLGFVAGVCIYKKRGDAVTHRLANGSTIFIWKLYCHWSKSLWLAISLQRGMSVYFVIWHNWNWNIDSSQAKNYKSWRLWAINIIDQLLQMPIIKLTLIKHSEIKVSIPDENNWFRIALANIVWQFQHHFLSHISSDVYTQLFGMRYW